MWHLPPNPSANAWQAGDSWGPFLGIISLYYLSLDPSVKVTGGACVAGSSGEEAKTQRKGGKARGVTLTVSDIEYVQGVDGHPWGYSQQHLKGHSEEDRAKTVPGVSRWSRWVGKELV